VPATPGNENQPSVLLQGHSDMVADKEESSTHDFDTDPLDIYVDGDFVKAKGTTLGADDGVALAMILALLNDSEFKHGPLEVIFSANEEVSPMGISAFDTSLIKSKYMLNIDSESSDLVTVGCAGCIIFDGVIKTKKIKSKKTNKSYCIEIKNGLGGHSGIEIHKKIINAVKASAELLNELEKTFEFSIVKINGGKFPNAIPHSCTTVIQCEKDELEEIVACASKKFAKIKSSYPDEINISLSIHEVENDSYSLSKKDSSIAIAALCDIFNGVYTNNKEFNIPNTSCNLGIIRTNENDITMTHMVRSLESNEMDKLYSLMSKTYKLASADIVYRDKMMP
jgi:dipeptidase D